MSGIDEELENFMYNGPEEDFGEPEAVKQDPEQGLRDLEDGFNFVMEARGNFIGLDDQAKKTLGLPVEEKVINVETEIREIAGIKE